MVLKLFVIPLALVALMVFAVVPVSAAYPPAGSDVFTSTADIVVDLSAVGGPILPIMLSTPPGGSTTIMRGAPGDSNLNGLMDIQTEMVALDLTGGTPFGPVTIKESPTLASTGLIEEQAPGTFFPANSFFDVFFELTLPSSPMLGPLSGGTCGNPPGSPATVSSVISSIPPAVGTSYSSTVSIVVPIIGIPPTPAIQCGRVQHIDHIVGPPPTTGVPEFGLPAAMVLVLSFVALIGLRRLRKVDRFPLAHVFQ